MPQLLIARKTNTSLFKILSNIESPTESGNYVRTQAGPGQKSLESGREGKPHRTDFRKCNSPDWISQTLPDQMVFREKRHERLVVRSRRASNSANSRAKKGANVQIHNFAKDMPNVSDLAANSANFRPVEPLRARRGGA